MSSPESHFKVIIIPERVPAPSLAAKTSDLGESQSTGSSEQGDMASCKIARRFPIKMRPIGPNKTHKLGKIKLSFIAASMKLQICLHLLLLLCLDNASLSGQFEQQQQESVARNSTSTTTTTPKPNYLETGRQITKILDRFMTLGYDKRVRPNYGGPPVEVNVTMRILSISSVSEVQMDFTADFYFRQTWADPRLAFRKLGDIQTLYVGAEVSKKIWLPDTFFGNEKMAYFHEATTPNVFLRIDHSGEVYRSIRLTVTSSCPMNLQYFPMDRQRCTIEAESYGYNVKDIIYRWARGNAVERDNQISLPQFDIVKTVQKYRLEELSSGTYSRLIAELHFSRRMGYYLIQIYIPSSLIVVISWVSFWLHRNASPARVQLGVTTVLTMTTLMSSTNAALPKISYVKSIDIFLGTCFIMVFAALLEYATVGYLGKRLAMRRARFQHAQSQANARLFAHLATQNGAPSDAAAAAAAAAAAMHGGSSVPPTDGPNIFGFGHSATVAGGPNTSASATDPSHIFNSSTATATTSGGIPPALLHQFSSLSQSTPMTADLTPQQQQHFAFVNLETPPQAPKRNQHRCNFNPHRSGGAHCCHGNSKATPCCASSSSRRVCDHQQLGPRQVSDGTSESPLRQCSSSSNFQQHPTGAAFPQHKGAQAAAAAAAATFINLHRRNKGLPPSDNPNFAPFTWMPNQQMQKIDTIFGVRPSSIDKYSRVIFPISFTCFLTIYSVVYLKISAFLEVEAEKA